MKRVYHPFWLWEDFKCGFYDNISGDKKKELSKKVVEMFNSPEKTKYYMMKVINEWKYSCEHNLTNDSLNKIAYLGQGACCLYAGIPNSITMESWSLLTKEVQNESDRIAKEVLTIWENKNKNIQLCLNLD